MKIGDKIKMEGEKQRYTVQAFDKRFVILTKPFNAVKNYLYSIVDLEQGIRGRDNLVFGFPYNYNTLEGAKTALEWLNRNEDEECEMEVSYRHYKPLEQSEIDQLVS